MPEFIRKRPVIFSAVQWTGNNLDEVKHTFLELNIKHPDVIKEDGPAVKIWSKSAQTWIPLIKDWWIVQDDTHSNEFWLCDPEQFDRIAEPILPDASD